MTWASPQLSTLLLLADPGVWGPEDTEKGTNVLRSTNFRNDVTLDLSKLALRSIPESKRDAKLLEPGDIILERSGGSPRQPVGRVRYFPGDDRSHTFSNFCQRLRVDAKVCEPRFLFWFLHWFHVTGRTLQYQKQTTGIRNLEYRAYLKQRIPLPTPTEQRRIVEILDRADELRNLRAAASATAARVPTALYTRMFGDPATNPMGWETSRLGTLAINLRYGTSKRCHEDMVGTPVLRIPNIIRGEIDPSDLKYCELSGKERERFSLIHGDLLFVRTNGNPDYVGRCAVFGEPREYSFASYLIRVRVDTNEVQPGFLSALLNTPMGRRSMAPYIRTTAGQSNINTDGLRQIPVPLPPRELQQRFCDVLSDFKSIRSEKEGASDRLSELFSVLLHRAFAGELTAAWREAHMKEVLKDMNEQARALSDATDREVHS